jgi:hypothetical protein
VLFLAHGNGLDDNADGEPAGEQGPRRFDAYCDPLGTAADGVPVEDHQAPRATGCESSSLMATTAGCSNLTELQAEQALAVARLLPGCNGTPCAKP